MTPVTALELDTAKGADLGLAGGALVIDLNFLYHPSCRYDDRSERRAWARYCRTG